jgi:hypothetical protein
VEDRTFVRLKASTGRSIPDPEVLLVRGELKRSTSANSQTVLVKCRPPASPRSLPWLECIFADTGYNAQQTHEAAAANYTLRMEIVR